MDDAQRNQLLNILKEPVFTLAVLEELCYKLGVDWDNFAHEKPVLVLGIIKYCEARDILPNLLRAIFDLHPKADLSLFGEFVEPETGRPFVPVAPFYDVPALPSHYLHRGEHIENIKNLLLKESGGNVGITGIAQIVGLQGMGGIGKSILAAAVANDQDVRRYFVDGILWIRFGSEPDILSTLNRAIANLAPSLVPPDTIPESVGQFNRLLIDKKMLLILDDVWHIEDLEHFNFSAPLARLLITTREARVLRGASAEEYQINVLSEDQALSLLRKQSRWPDAHLPAAANAIIKECGYLPLAVSMVGAMLRGRPQNRWQHYLELLKNAQLKKIDQPVKDYPHPSLFKALHVSVETQPAVIQRCYLSLAVFPENIPIPEAVLDLYWSHEDLDDKSVFEIIDTLEDASLIFRYDESRLQLHDLQRDYIISQCPDVQQCHANLVQAYQNAYPHGWSTVPYEKPYYFYNHFFRHLQALDDQTQAKETARRVLFEYPYLSWAQVKQYLEFIGLTPEKAAAQLIQISQATDTLRYCSTLLGKDAQPYVKNFLREHNSPQVIALGLRMLDKAAAPEARQLIKTHRAPVVLAECLNVLGSEAREDAKRLLAQQQNAAVIIACLRILGSDARAEAKQLLREHPHPTVLVHCLTLLGEEARAEAAQLLEKSKHPHVIAACLDVIGADAKPAARQLLLDKNPDPYLVAACLSLLGSEAKTHARRLLHESTVGPVLVTCLNLLGSEARDEALRLSRQSQDTGVLLTCLKILGSSAPDEARRLLRESSDATVIVACLKLLHLDAKPEARRLLGESRDEQVLVACLKILGAEAKPAAKQLLQDDNQSTSVLAACLRLLGDEAKDEARRFMRQEPPNEILVTAGLQILGADAKAEAKMLLVNSRVTSVLIAGLRLLGREAAPDAMRMLDDHSYPPEVLVAALKLLGSQAKPQARRLLLDHALDSAVHVASLKLLGSEAREEAAQLVMRSPDGHVIATCIDILGPGARESVKTLIKTSHDPLVLVACLKYLGQDAFPNAQRMLREPQDPKVHIACLKLLGADARPEAARLVSQTADFELLIACLNVLGEDGKADALRILDAYSQPSLLLTCLKILGEDGKPAARKLLAQSHPPDVYLACLKLLGADALEEARALLARSTNIDLINACLEILGGAARPEARKILAETSDPAMIVRCLSILGADGKPEARRLLSDQQDRGVLYACLSTLGADAGDFVEPKLLSDNWRALDTALLAACLSVPIKNRALRQTRALDILWNWRKTSRVLVFAALSAFDNEPDRAHRFCLEIIKNWEYELEYQRKKNLRLFTSHIIKAMAHPNLRAESIQAAKAMLKKHAAGQVYLGDSLLAYAQSVVDGTDYTWGQTPPTG